jgi:hypothetical protein
MSDPDAITCPVDTATPESLRVPVAGSDTIVTPERILPLAITVPLSASTKGNDPPVKTN